MGNGHANALRDSKGRRLPIDRVGHRYGRLTVLRENGRWRRGVTWLCRCDCGNELTVPAFSLSSGNTNSCGCYRLDRLRDRLCKGPGVAARNRAVSVMKANARHRDIPWSIDDEDLFALIARNCTYCGAEPQNLAPGTGERSGDFVYNGLDRLDSDGGYEISNVVPCCFDCNNAKRTMTVAAFLAWVARVHAHSNMRKGG